MNCEDLERFRIEKKLNSIKKYLEELKKEVECTEPDIEDKNDKYEYWRGQCDIISNILDFIGDY